MNDKSVYAIVSSENKAGQIVDTLHEHGFSTNDISVLLPDKVSTHEFSHEKNTKAPEGALTGVATGGVLGGTLGLLIGIGTLAIPGVGPLIAAGPLLAALSGAAAGATLGGIAGGSSVSAFLNWKQNATAIVSLRATSSFQLWRGRVKTSTA